MCNTSVYSNFKHYFQYTLTLHLQVDYTFIFNGFRSIIRTFVANGLKSLDNIAVAWKKIIMIFLVIYISAICDKRLHFFR